MKKRTHLFSAEFLFRAEKMGSRGPIRLQTTVQLKGWAQSIFYIKKRKSFYTAGRRDQ